MSKVDENIQTAQNMLNGIVERCYELEEENKKLKEENEYLQNRVKGAENMIELLKEDKRSYEDKLTELMEFIEKNFGIE